MCVFENVYNRHDPLFILDVYGERCTEQPSGRADRAGCVASIPGIQVQIADVVEQVGHVAVRVIFQATHKGEFLEIPATEKSIRWEAMGLLW